MSTRHKKNFAGIIKISRLRASKNVLPAIRFKGPIYIFSLSYTDNDYFSISIPDLIPQFFFIYFIFCNNIYIDIVSSILILITICNILPYRQFLWLCYLNHSEFITLPHIQLIIYTYAISEYSASSNIFNPNQSNASYNFSFSPVLVIFFFLS